MGPGPTAMDEARRPRLSRRTQRATVVPSPRSENDVRPGPHDPRACLRGETECRGTQEQGHHQFCGAKSSWIVRKSNAHFGERRRDGAQLRVVPGLALQAPDERTIGRCSGSVHARSLTGPGVESGRIRPARACASLPDVFQFVPPLLLRHGPRMTIDRYLVRAFAGPFVVGWFVLTAIFAAFVAAGTGCRRRRGL